MTSQSRTPILVARPRRGINRGDGARGPTIGPEARLERPCDEQAATPRAAAWLALGAAALELALALALHTASALGVCPGQGGGCAALVRPRVAALGPLSVSLLASLGALATLLAAASLLRARPPSPRLAHLGAILPAAGAGLALGLQALPWAAGLAACRLCLALLAATLLAALLLAAALRGAVALRRPALAFGVALALAAPLAAWRGQGLAEEDAARRVAVLAAKGPRGPRLVLVSREGCAYCQALLLDHLAEPEALALLARTRGLEQVDERHPLAAAHAGGPGAPVLLALAEDGRLAARLRGLPERGALLAWLEQQAR